VAIWQPALGAKANRDCKGRAMDRIARAAACASLALATLGAGATAAAEFLPHEDFEGPETSWQLGEYDVPFRLLAHRRTTSAAHGGTTCEHLRFQAGRGTHVHWWCDAGGASVIGELEPALWLRSNRAGMRLAVRVVLPRTDDGTGRPRAVLLHGDTYEQQGAWQRLAVRGLPHMLSRQARLMRLDTGEPIDTTGAYADKLEVNVYGGPGTTDVWLDDLKIVGYAPRPAGDHAIQLTTGEETAPRSVELAGALLMVDGKPLFPRIVQHRGEPLALLRELGFNGIRLREPPEPALREEAAREGLWIVCPPPIPRQQVDPAEAGWGAIGEEFECVLAWDLGEDLARGDLAAVRDWSAALRRADRRLARPHLASPRAELRGYSRFLDILETTRQPLGGSTGLAEHSAWLRSRPRLARLGTPTWTTIQTSLAAGVLEQVELVGGSPASAAASTASVQLLVHAALAAGCRGLLFDTPARLDDASDPDVARLARVLTLLNLELELIAPWAATGKLLDALPSAPEGVTAAHLQVDRARLLAPWADVRFAQCAPAPAPSAGVAFTVPVPETYKAYDLSLCGLRALPLARGSGGARCTTNVGGTTGYLLLTQEPVVLAGLTRQIDRRKDEAAELCRALAEDQFRSTERLAADWLAAGADRSELDAALSAARSVVGRAAEHVSAGRPAAAREESLRAVSVLLAAERQVWMSAAADFPSPVASPCLASAATLPRHRTWHARLLRSSLAPNRLAAGDCERLDRLQDAGWRHVQHPQEGLQATVEISSAEAHAGRSCVRLRAWPVDESAPPAVVETPPVWITSAAVATQAGQLWRIHAWVRVPGPIRGSVDGLLVVDSLAGAALADRIGATEGWREVTLYRAAPRSGELSVTFALTGLGEALIDDVTIEPVLEPRAQTAGAGGDATFGPRE
jgi:hypothetical protein